MTWDKGKLRRRESRQRAVSWAALTLKHRLTGQPEAAFYAWRCAVARARHGLRLEVPR